MLPEIKTCKPRLPEDLLDAENDGTTETAGIGLRTEKFEESNIREVSSTVSSFSAVSRDFRELIDRVVEQHVYEISKLGGKGCRATCESHRTEAQKTPKTPASEHHYGSEHESFTTDSMHSMESRHSIGSHRRRTSITGVLREKHKDMREIHASEILDAWNDSITTSTFREPYLATLQKSKTLLSDSSEIPSEEYLQMSRFQKVQAWFESHHYESMSFGMKSRSFDERKSTSKKLNHF